MKRKHLSNRRSRKLFSKTAKKAHPKNLKKLAITRGGYRI